MARCTICNSPNTKDCSSCRSSAYCSVECQQTDWPLHKIVCKSFTTILPTRPTAFHKLAIVFPPDARVPRLGWVLCGEKEDDMGGKHQYSETMELFGGGDRCQSANQSPTKTSILAATGGLMTHDWRGQILVLSKLTTTWDPRYYQDVTAADLRVAVDYFVTYGVDDLKSKGRLHPKSGLTVKGVRVNCLVDHKVFAMKKGPLIAKLLGLEVYVAKYPADRAWKDDSSRDVDGWGWAPSEWDERVGSNVIVRADRKPITPNQVETLCHYSQFKLLPLFEDSMGAGLEERTREEVMGHLTRTKFETFFERYKEERAAEDISWVDERSPYET
ncbi:hypothetical protein BDZ45DRAFT_800272 [Acephala macrosclerotiorum]|nr:hypothetical protein BDZ45DRAFT_800272 [Acephala macrosclerotiorum]